MQTKYDFLCGSFEQEHPISSVRFFFFINTYKDLREDAYICPSQPKKAPQNLLLHGKLNSGLQFRFEGFVRRKSPGAFLHTPLDTVGGSSPVLIFIAVIILFHKP